MRILWVAGLGRGISMLWLRILGSRERLRHAFEEAGILKELIGILDNVDSTLVIAEGYRDLPSVLIRTFVYDSFSRLDDLAREYRGYVGKVMDYVCEELRAP
jgi:hypothetical protein